MYKAVVVEDETITRRGIVLTVNWASLNCVLAGEASNGEEGASLIARISPDIVITDVKMPRMDGVEMISKLRQEGCNSKFIILTAHSDFKYAQSALRMGVSDYLLKYKGWRGPAVRNISTTHMLDKVAESFGMVCYEVPVGFKHISAKMQETDAIIGGESSGGLTVKGHIHGKDGIYAAALLVEMIAVSGKRLSEISEDIKREYGAICMVEWAYRFTPEERERIYGLLMVQRTLPEMAGYEVCKVSYLDGCKVYFQNGSWISARFSGTEPLLRIFCEMPKKEEAVQLCRIWEEFLGL